MNEYVLVLLLKYLCCCFLVQPFRGKRNIIWRMDASPKKHLVTCNVIALLSSSFLFASFSFLWYSIQGSFPKKKIWSLVFHIPPKKTINYWKPTIRGKYINIQLLHFCFKRFNYFKSYHGKTKILKFCPFFATLIPLSLCLLVISRNELLLPSHNNVFINLLLLWDCGKSQKWRSLFFLAIKKLGIVSWQR